MKLNKIFKHLLLLAGALLLINTAIMAVVANFNSGVIFSVILSIILILCGIYFDLLTKVKWMIYTTITAFSLLIALVLFITIYGIADNVTYNEDAIIVLGAGINGETVTKPLAERLNKAVEYHSKNPNAVIVVSGGQGFQETITEALAMERYLIAGRIPKEKIIKEEKSTSTYTNLFNSKEILDELFANTPYKITLITNNFHIYRAVRVAKTVGFDCTHYHAGIKWYAIPMSYLRECVAVVKVWIMGV